MLGREATGTATAPRRRPPRTLAVVYDPVPEEIGAEVDWSGWYLTDEEDMGEGGEQGLIIWALRSALLELARERGWQRVHIGADQFFAWMPDEPLVRVSPDVYLLDEPPSPPLPAMWETWRPGQRPPRLAFEIVSGPRWQKDYREGPAKYAQLGTAELVIFDPEAATGAVAHVDRVALQVFRREADGTFLRAYAGDGPARTMQIDAWVVVRREGAAARLALARDAAGRDLVPTTEQARAAEQRAREQAEQARAAEQQAREAAERKLGEALAELERLRGGGRSG
ncbi:MAG: Uma2 family endonuclease [Deltaproteobacteria bacterium]|nr:Uma2 family endonuclease [Deltaproteobacteria bacterium]